MPEPGRPTRMGLVMDSGCGGHGVGGRDVPLHRRDHSLNHGSCAQTCPTRPPRRRHLNLLSSQAVYAFLTVESPWGTVGTGHQRRPCQDARSTCSWREDGCRGDGQQSL